MPCPLMYLTAGELVDLITSEPYWPIFKKYFLGSMEIIKTKFSEIISIRNSLAHFRPIKQDDVDLIKQTAKHVLTTIENCIYEMVTCRDIVPTNKTDDWYSQLKPLGNESVILSFSQSNDGNWIQIRMTYTAPIVSTRVYHKFRSYGVLKIISPSILREHPVLSKNVIFLSESIPYTSMNKDLSPPTFQKEINLVFSLDTLKSTYTEIKPQFESVLNSISKETELIKQDNLARGKFVQTGQAYASATTQDKEEKWSVQTDDLICTVNENDPPEYWGPFWTYNPNFISGTHMFPWMPVYISKIEHPF